MRVGQWWEWAAGSETLVYSTTMIHVSKHSDLGFKYLYSLNCLIVAFSSEGKLSGYNM